MTRDHLTLGPKEGGQTPAGERVNHASFSWKKNSREKGKQDTDVIIETISWNRGINDFSFEKKNRTVIMREAKVKRNSRAS